MTMLASKRIIVVMCTSAFLQACANTSPTEATAGASSAYVLNTSDTYVMHGDVQCVRTIGWTDGTVECQSSAPAPEPVEATVGTALVSYRARALFAFDSFDLSSDGRQQLDQLTAKLNSQDEITKIEIVGHTDSIGSESYNLVLSEQRAESVKAYLQQSLNNVSVISNGMGENAPVGDNKTEEGRQLNRRVDVQIAALQER